ncbi:MAG: glycosyltransferase [candidate division Zixibacteria bacterium]|nr:glycosyltransferase [candidate division Zixibacteria bacterium]
MDGVKVLTIGNLVPRKRIDLCARTCAELEKKHRLSWTVIGNGPEEEKIKSLAPESMTVRDRVESLTEFYKMADIFVLPSLDEGFGMVYIEAIMCGCPVVCRKNDGGEEIIDKTGGGLAIDIPADDDKAAAAIAGAIEKILENRVFYTSEEIIVRARDLVDPASIKDKWERLLGKYAPFLSGTGRAA